MVVPAVVVVGFRLVEENQSNSGGERLNEVSLAMTRKFVYAAYTPHRGRNLLDALELGLAHGTRRNIAKFGVITIAFFSRYCQCRQVGALSRRTSDGTNSRRFYADAEELNDGAVVVVQVFTDEQRCQQKLSLSGRGAE